ncbi:MAG: FkbM family methyltransferase [Eubacteriaceae bacterium]|nr:FkbM family methyltransferase [Eubacteriaceae bacterium]
MAVSFWDRIKEEKKPVVIYGTGNGVDRLIDRLSLGGIKVGGVFASDGFVRDRSFRGFKVMSLSGARELFGDDMLILLGFGSDRAEVVSSVKRLSGELRVACPRIPLYDDVFIDSSFIPLMRERFASLAGRLADEESRRTLSAIEDYRISGDLQYLFGCEGSEDDTFRSVLDLCGSEDYWDIGAYRGDTIDLFLGHAGTFSSIGAVEPDGKSFEKLTEHTAGIENVSLFNVFCSDVSGTVNFTSGSGRGSSSGRGRPVVSGTLDELTGGGRVSFLKIDAEGAEEKVLMGGCGTIEKYRPKMKIAVYHRANDIWRIPEVINGIRDDYRIYLRHYPAFPDWNTEMIFV